MDSDRLALLARTTTMTSEGSTALLVLADTAPGETSLEVPFNSGLASSIADTALFIADGTVRVADLATGDVAPLADAVAVANPQGWTNAIEASLPLDAIGGSAQGISLAVASGIVNESGDGFAHLSIETTDDLPHANVANVAFRLDEPVRVWFEKKQGLSLFEGSIDPFFYELDASAMQAGTTQRYVPGPGYHERIFVSDTSTGVPREGGRDGVFQHYGIFLPSAYEGDPVPLQWWLHWRGGNAHSGASIVPKVFKQFGEDRDSIVVAPSGRGTSTWYVGRGHVDVLEVWADVFDTFAVDRDRVYVSGHSMGGWGSYLLTLLYPDRFAAAAPVAGPVTQGAWTGLDFPGCDDFESDGTTPCYVSVNGGRGRDQHTRKILENARHVPYAILQGTDDELVWYSGVFRQSERLIELGYRHRLYSYPGYEHYSHPIADQWAEAASYLHSFVRDANPAQISYKRDMLFERATEEVQAGNAVLDFDFDSAYWMSELTATDAGAGTASFEGRSLAIPEEPYIAAPDTGAPTAPGQTGPYAITGLQWLPDPTAATPEPVNGFEVTLTGADAVRLDLARMSIDPSATIAGAVNTGNDLDLRLDAGWIGRPEVLIDGERVNFFWNHELLTVSVPAGSHSVTIQDRRHGHDR
jgi:pimeloyl-ACP methyl ester carboxylesterase